MNNDGTICPLSGNICNHEKNIILNISGVAGKFTSQACEKCVGNLQELNYNMNVPDKNNFLDSIINTAKIFVNEITKKSSKLYQNILKKSNELGPCPTCHMNLLDIVQAGRLGCPTCHEKFTGCIQDFIKDSNKTKDENTEVVKESCDTPTSSVLSKIKTYLESELVSCVKLENYESASVVRDLLKLIDKRINKSS